MEVHFVLPQNDAKYNAPNVMTSKDSTTTQLHFCKVITVVLSIHTLMLKVVVLYSYI